MNNPATTTETLTPADAAKVLRCSPDQVRALIAAGRLPAVNIGLGSCRARWIIPRSLIDELLTPARSNGKTAQKQRAPPPKIRDWV